MVTDPIPLAAPVIKTVLSSKLGFDIILIWCSSGVEVVHGSGMIVNLNGFLDEMLHAAALREMMSPFLRGTSSGTSSATKHISQLIGILNIRRTGV